MSALNKENLISKGHFSPGIGVLVCIPTLGRELCIEWAHSFKSLAPPINYNMNVLTLKGMAVADARNVAVREAIAKNNQYLFFLGDDTIPPGDILKRMIYRMEHDSDLGVVGGVYCAKSDPPFPLVFQEWGNGSDWNWKVGEYFPVRGMGMDATLIRVSMLKEMQDPWFKTVDDDQGIDGINKAESWTEDLYFCDQIDKQVPHWRKYIDASILCGHYEHNTGRIIFLPGDSKPMQDVVEKGKDEKAALDIGAGRNPISISGYKVVTFDKQGPADYRGDASSLPFPSKSFDLIYSSHTLEHIPKKDMLGVVVEWMRVLKDDGLFVLKLPDLEWALENLGKAEEAEHVYNVLYGAQQDKLDFHCNGFTLARLESLLTPFKQIMVKKRDKYNLLAIASNAEEAVDFDAVERVILGS